MDGDPAVEPELDSFSLFLPLPYRVAFILVLGRSRTDPLSSALLAKPIFAPSVYLPIRNPAYPPSPTLASPLLDHHAWYDLPLSRTGRYRFLSTLKRVSIGGLAEAHDGKFGDILMADVLTSYAKVLGDLFVALCMFVSSGKSSTGQPDRGCGGQFLVPIIISVPSMVRLRQCLIEFLRVQRSKGGPEAASAGWGGQHLANALKYASAFPVIILSALQRGYDPAKMGMSEARLFRLWLFFVFLNSFYSFYWDVAKDWDLTLFSSAFERQNPEHPWVRNNRGPASDNILLGDYNGKVDED
ncbi:hypothetical protein LTR04_003241 [Oleoguttula sp. CCFEE 6159]|nr:hypothetical protein LTR04_003241 [Oleoguttula sp. CCFEE 6159]